AGARRRGAQHLPAAAGPQRRQHLRGHHAQQHPRGLPAAPLQPDRVRALAAAVGAGGAPGRRAVRHRWPRQEHRPLAPEQARLDHAGGVRSGVALLPPVRRGVSRGQHRGPPHRAQRGVGAARGHGAGVRLPAQLRRLQP
ncbi:Protein of unknown function, partial [Gryllus bimaculatus]